ncbi:MAG: hypothetical protein KGM16_16375 [Bacteroidota bacterium]|nr:hypothetical protein [Bacteroidota bacterium]
MTHTRALIFFGILLISCNNNQTKIEVDPTWIKHQLPYGWTITTPSKFKIGKLQGIDSQVGYISSLADSILLNYDIGDDIVPKDRDCNLSNEYEQANLRILNEKENQSNFQIDTIDEKIAIIETPKTKGNGQTRISIQDCKTGAWLGINGENLNSQREKLVVKIFQTIKLDK